MALPFFLNDDSLILALKMGYQVKSGTVKIDIISPTSFEKLRK